MPSWLEALLPSVMVSLFGAGCLTAVLRRNAYQALFGIITMAWATVLFLGMLSVRAGSLDGMALAVSVTFLFGIQFLTALWILHWRHRTNGDLDLDA